MTEISIDEYLNNRTNFLDDYLRVKELKVTGKAPKDCSGLFSGFKGEKLDLSKLDTSETTDMCYFFADCPSLKEINLTGLDTKNVTNMESFFEDCHSLKEVNLASLDTSKVENMRYFFDNCKSLEEVGLIGFDTKNVKNMLCFFFGCESIKKLDLSSFNLKKCKFTNCMFTDVKAEIVASDPKIMDAVRLEQEEQEGMEHIISIKNDIDDIDY
ncbi:MAG: DUF285 domain-containing protein [Eubacterium sp.]|nr:DUF285 domain-containing protein [Eubacterium sp.]